MIETKKAFYAAVGAPLVGLKRTGDALKELSDKLAERFGDMSEKLTGDARKEFDLWADEGEKLIGKISEQKVVEDLSARVDLDEIQERVGKLRDQLEDILTSWRESFSPSETVEKPVVEVEKKPVAKKPAAKTAAARKPAAKTAPARKPAAKKAPASKPVAKATAAKKPAAKATAAKKPAAEATAAK